MYTWVLRTPVEDTVSGRWWIKFLGLWKCFSEKNREFVFP